MTKAFFRYVEPSRAREEKLCHSRESGNLGEQAQKLGFLLTNTVISKAERFDLLAVEYITPVDNDR